MHNKIEVNPALFFKKIFFSSETDLSIFCFFLTYKIQISCLTGKNSTMLKSITHNGSWKDV